MNAEIVKDKMIGTVLDYKEVDEEALERAIKHLLGDKSVKENIDRMATLVKDSRTHPLEVSRYTIRATPNFPIPGCHLVE